MRYGIMVTVLAALMLSLTILAVAQTRPLAFEVASVKPVQAPGESFSVGCYSPSSRLNLIPKGMCVARSAPLRYIIGEAYGISIFEIADLLTGGPGWVGSDRFDIEGKAEDLSSTTGQLHAMLRNLLAERFKLQVHEETRDTSGYALVIGKNGPKLKPSSGDKPVSIGTFHQPTNEVEAANASMADLARYFSRQFHRPFVDKTGLTGQYDFTAKLLTDDVQPPIEGVRQIPARGRVVYGLSDSDLPSLSSALQEQLGLKLQPEKLPLTRIVIDHAEKPDAN